MSSRVRSCHYHQQLSLTFLSKRLDASIRVTYHPLVKKSSQSGIISKTSTTLHDDEALPSVFANSIVTKHQHQFSLLAG